MQEKKFEDHFAFTLSLVLSQFRVATTEAQLRDIADELRFDADKFVSLVKENERILAQMKVSGTWVIIAMEYARPYVA